MSRTSGVFFNTGAKVQEKSSRMPHLVSLRMQVNCFGSTAISSFMDVALSHERMIIHDILGPVWLELGYGDV